MDDVRIVPATAADLPSIAALAAVTWRANYPGIISNEQIDYMLARMYDLKTMRRELAVGICYDRLLLSEEFVAFAAYGPATVTEMKVHKLYVHPDRQRLGLGSQLLKHTEAVARSRGFQTVCLAVNKRNGQAIAAYEKNGFAVRGSVRIDIGRGFFMDDYVMSKTL